MKIIEFSLPNPTREEIHQAKEQIRFLIKKNNVRYWRKDYLEAFPEMDTGKGYKTISRIIDKDNEYINIPVYHTLFEFFTKYNKQTA